MTEANNSILILTNCIAGIYTFRREVVKAIIEKGFDVYISYPDVDDKRGDYFDEIGCKRIPTIFNRRGVNPFADLQLMLKYRQTIKQIKPIAVLSYTIKPNVYGGLACRLTHTPQLANVTGLGDAVENGGWLQKLTIKLYKMGLRQAHKVFFQNDSNRNYCINAGIADNTSILLPGSGVNLDFHTFQDYPANGNIRFLYIGRIMKDKGSKELFEMARIIKSRHSEVSFQVLGSLEDDFKQQLDNLVKERIVEYTEHSMDVRPFLKEAHCCIMPSYHEGMSNVNLESAANGRPVITTDVPGCRETIDDGITGFMVKSHDSGDLTDKVERFISLSYEKKMEMGLAARKKVEREFDRNIVINAYLKELESLKS